MNYLDYNEVVNDINIRMKDFESKRIGSFNTNTTTFQTPDVIFEKAIFDNTFPTDKYLDNSKTLPEIKNPNATNLKKDNKGFFKSISDFFSDDPATVAANKKRADEKKRLDLEKTLLAKKLVEEKKLAEILAKETRKKMELEKAMLAERLVEEKKLAEILAKETRKKMEIEKAISVEKLAEEKKLAAIQKELNKIKK